MVAPKGLISCRRAENIHGSLKSDEAPSLTSFLWGGVMPNGHSKYHTPFFPARPWQRSFNPRQTVRDISSRLKSRRIKFYLLFTVPYAPLQRCFVSIFLFSAFLPALTNDWSARTMLRCYRVGFFYNLRSTIVIVILENVIESVWSYFRSSFH